jgi:hypothetical protein
MAAEGLGLLGQWAVALLKIIIVIILPQPQLNTP